MPKSPYKHPLVTWLALHISFLKHVALQLSNCRSNSSMHWFSANAWPRAWRILPVAVPGERKMRPWTRNPKPKMGKTYISQHGLNGDKQSSGKKVLKSWKQYTKLYKNNMTRWFNSRPNWNWESSDSLDHPQMTNKWPIHEKSLSMVPLLKSESRITHIVPYLSEEISRDGTCCR